MIKGIGIKLKGEFTKEGNLTTYQMTEEEKKLEKEGKIAVIGVSFHTFNPKDGSSTVEHNYNIVNMEKATKIDIFYDIEDDYMMDQTITLENGETVWGRSRDHEEVAQWEQNGYNIHKGYGW